MQTLHLIKGLRERGHHNFLIAQNNSPLAARAAESNIDAISVRMRGEWDLLAVLELRRIAKETSPDLIHAHTGHALTLALLTRIGNRRLRVVCSRRVSFALRHNFLTRLKYESVDGILAVSEAVRDQLIRDGISESKIWIAESGTDFSVFDRALPRDAARARLHIPKDTFVIGNISHFDANKGQENLILAFHQFLKAHPEEPCRLLLCGDGPLLSRCQSMARELGCSDRVLFIGEQTDIENLYPAIDLFFLASLRGEGWSGVLREAMGSELACVAVRQPAIDKQLADGQTGILVPPDTSLWTKAIERLYRDPAERERLAAHAKLEARQYTVEAMVEKTEICYQDVLSK